MVIDSCLVVKCLCKLSAFKLLFARTSPQAAHSLTYSMADYTAILLRQNLYHYTFCHNTPVKTIIWDFPISTSSQDITLALQEFGIDVIHVKQMTAKHLSPEPSSNYIFTPVIMTLAHCKKWQVSSPLPAYPIFSSKLNLAGPRVASHVLHFGHIWVPNRQLPRCLWCKDGQCHLEFPERENSSSVPKCWNCNAL
jgi:hypothetical protein